MKDREWARTLLEGLDSEAQLLPESAAKVLAQELRKCEGLLPEETLCALEIAVRGQAIDDAALRHTQVEDALAKLDRTAANANAESGFDIQTVQTITQECDDRYVKNYADNILRLHKVVVRQPANHEQQLLASAILRVAATRPSQRITRRREELERLKTKGIFGERAKQIAYGLHEYKTAISLAEPLIDELVKLDNIQRELHVPAPKGEAHQPIIVQNSSEKSGGLFIIVIVITCSVTLGMIRALNSPTKSPPPRKRATTAMELQELLQARMPDVILAPSYSDAYYGEVLNRHLKGETYQATIALLYEQWSAFARGEESVFTWTSFTTVLAHAKVQNIQAYEVLTLRAESEQLSQTGEFDEAKVAETNAKFDAWFQSLATEAGDSNSFDPLLETTKSQLADEYKEITRNHRYRTHPVLKGQSDE